MNDDALAAYIDDGQSHVRCERCRAVLRVDFSRCMRTGWPKCCGYTMTLIKLDTLGET